jgi:hypothetical protein
MSPNVDNAVWLNGWRADRVETVMMTRILSVVATALLNVSSSAAAGTIERVPVAVSFCSTGGSWGTSDEGGVYRVLVLNEGFERLISSLWLEWIAYDQEKHQVVVVQRVEIKEFRISPWVLRTPRFINDSWFEIDGVTSFGEAKTRQFKVKIGPRGKYKIEGVTTYSID